MATKIVTKNSSTASAVPTASDLVQGELAVNVADKRLFTEDNAGAIVELGTNPTSLTVTGNVGIGTGSPRTLINASSSTGAILTLESSDTTLTTNGVIGGIDFYSNDSSTNGAGAKVNIRAIGQNSSGTATALTFGTSASGSATAVEAMRIDASGNVGINSASPAATLHTVANAGTTGFLLTGAASNNIASFYTSGGSQAMTLDSLGNLLVGKTSTDNTTAGTRIHPLGYASFTIANDYPIIANRLSSDGAIAVFRKDGADVGSIGTLSGLMYIGNGDCNLLFTGASDAILPVGTNGATKDGQLDLGSSGNRFKDLYLSGKVQASYIYRADASGAGLHFTTNAIYPTNETAALSDGTESLGAAAYRFKDLYLSGAATMDSLDLGGAGGEKLYVYDGGSVKSGFGVDLSGSSRELSIFHSTSATNGNISFGKRLESNGAYTEAVRIDGAGNLLVGKTASGTAQGFEVQSDGEVYTTIVNGLNTYHVYANSGYRFYVKPDGGIVNYSSNNVNLSDEREKKNIEPLESQWDSLKQWSLKKFHYSADVDSDNKKLGVIAQEVETHNPEVIDEFNVDDETTRMAVKEQQMMWMAIKALQEAQTRIETLEARVTELENN